MKRGPILRLSVASNEMRSLAMMAVCPWTTDGGELQTFT